MIRTWLTAAFVCLSSSLLMAQEPSRRLQELMATASDFYKAGAFQEALPVAQQALALTESEFGRTHERTGIQAYGVALTAEAAGQLDVAERAYGRVVAIREAVYGKDSPSVAMALEKLAETMVKQGRPEAAEPLSRRALSLRQAVIGPDHAFVAPSHAMLGHVAAGKGQWPQALASYREAIRLLAKQDNSFVGAKAVFDRELESHRDTFVGLVRAAYRLRDTPQGGSAMQLTDESFAAAQQAWNTSAAGALAKMTARLGAGATELGRAVRALQDKSDRIVALNAEDMALLSAWSDVQRKDPEYAALLEEFRSKSIEQGRVNAPAIARQRVLVDELQKQLARCPPGQTKAGCERSTAEREAITRELGQLSTVTSAGAGDLMAVHKRLEAAETKLAGHAAFKSRRAALRTEIDGLETDVRQSRQRILQTYPAYAALADPGALTVREVQGLLQDGEALVVILVGTDASFVWAIDRTRAQWAEIEAGSRQLAADVSALRMGLDPLAHGGVASLEEAAAAFDLDRAHALYRKILGPVAPMLAGKQHLVVVPTGALTSLPMQVLVTEAPPVTGNTADRLKAASWLVRRHALSVLPSVASLKALRSLARTGVAVRPFIGIGDPRLDGGGEADARGKGVLPARYYRNGQVDTRALRQLSPLPDTAQEVETVARVLGAGKDSVLLGDAATETEVKRRSLKDYRIVHFATHGLVAGDLSGLAEPALVLTPPAAPNELDDGLLTASEVAALTLDAEWVVLSACNTAAGDKVGAEALSGLARAFFYAGARALLVSHWSVYSDAATRLTIETFGALAADRKLGRAEAFRRAMIREIDDGKPPAYWAPFVVVGEGG
ncbi:MAG: CHAT domain-containing tetratricopeptide repeat protein [Hyphomicrobiaceae bacterium]